MIQFIIIFTFIFDLFTLLICAAVLHQVVKDRIVLAHFVEAANLYIKGFGEMAQKHNDTVEAFNETKDVVNLHAQLLQNIIEASSTFAPAPLEWPVAPRKRKSRTKVLPKDQL